MFCYRIKYEIEQYDYATIISQLWSKVPVYIIKWKSLSSLVTFGGIHCKQQGYGKKSIFLRCLLLSSRLARAKLHVTNLLLYADCHVIGWDTFYEWCFLPLWKNMRDKKTDRRSHRRIKKIIITMKKIRFWNKDFE